MKKLAITLSHPIQHFCPLYANWAKRGDWAIRVFFASTVGRNAYFDRKFGKTISWKGLRLEEFDHEFVNGDDDAPIGPRLDAPQAAASLADFAPDAVLTYGYSQRFQRRASSWAAREGVPIVYFGDSELRQHRRWWTLAIKAPVLRWYFRRVSWFLVTGNANEEYYLNYGVRPDRMIRASYPIDRDLYEKAWQDRSQLRESVRSALDVPSDSVVVTMVGKLIDIKRQIDLVHALRRISGCHVTLLIIGTGALELSLRSAAERIEGHRVVCAGFVEAHELPAYYAATDIYAHVSGVEPHSVAVSEAIYMGCPVVISDRCGSYGLDDDVQVGHNGFTFECGNIAELARRLQSLARDASLRRSMSQISHGIAARNQQTVHDLALDTLGRLLDG